MVDPEENIFLSYDMNLLEKMYFLLVLAELVHPKYHSLLYLPWALGLPVSCYVDTPMYWSGFILFFLKIDYKLFNLEFF